jgi:hypothetical protein
MCGASNGASGGLRRVINPVRLCRMEKSLVEALREDRSTEPFSLGWSLLIVLGMAAFGAAFGCWRSPRQALFGAIKMPLMLHAVVWLSVAANTMLNWLLGGGLSVRQVRRCVLGALSITAVLLASLSPVVAYLVTQAPRPEAPGGLAAYRVLLSSLVIGVGCAGVVGYARLFRLLRALTPNRGAAWRVLVAWVLTTGLVVTQCSWLLSPFVQRPDLAITFWNPAAFSSNFFEHLWFQVFSPWLGTTTTD